MVHLLILHSERSDTDRLKRWADFFRIKYSILNSGEELPWFPDHEVVIVITPDLYPEPQLLAIIFNQKDLKLVTPLAFFQHNAESSRPIFPSRGVRPSRWYPSFCLLTVGKDLVQDLESLPSVTRFDECQIPMDVSIASPETKDPWFKLAGTSLSSDERFNTLWGMVRDYWYGLSEDLVRRFIIHLWIHHYQTNVLKKSNPFDDSKLDWIRGQSVFSTAFKRQDLGLISIEEAQSYLGDSPTIDECYYNQISGYTAKVLLPRNRISRHPLSINGKIVLQSFESESDLNFDSSVTVVGFYYNLGYSEKPKEDYLRSIEDYSQIRHPLVFFGDASTCKLVFEARKGLEEYTLCVEKPLEDWSLIQMFKQDFEHPDTELDFKKRRRYSILTCLKSWALEEAIIRNPFLTKIYAWFDPGIYRHSHLASEKLVGIPLFKNAKKSQAVLEGKILFPGMCSSPGTTEEQFDQNVENVIANVLVGQKEAWINFQTAFSELCISRFSQGKFCTEQVLISRLAGIRPNLFEFKLMGFQETQLIEFLDLKETDLN